MMSYRPVVLTLVLTIALGAGAAQAACFADYRASRGEPLRLQYGVAEVRGDCDARSAARELEGRLADAGWQLLEVIATFDEAGLEERRESAGEYFLRY